MKILPVRAAARRATVAIHQLHGFVVGCDILASDLLTEMASELEYESLRSTEPEVSALYDAAVSLIRARIAELVEDES